MTGMRRREGVKKEPDTLVVGEPAPLVFDEREMQAHTWGFYTFALELAAIALVVMTGLLDNKGKKWVRLSVAGCHRAWGDSILDHELVNTLLLEPGPSAPLEAGMMDTQQDGGGAMGGGGGVIHYLREMPYAALACCNPNAPYTMDWSAGICEAASSPTTDLLTSRWAFLLPLAPLLANMLLTWMSPYITSGNRGIEGTVVPSRGEALAAQRRRLKLYAFIIAFRVVVLFLLLNGIQDQLQGSEHDVCWYAPHRHDRRCRSRFDFADHCVLFVCQYLSIMAFEAFAAAREATSALHASVPLGISGVISYYSLKGMYATVRYFHTRTESFTALVLSTTAVQLPMWLLASGQLGARFEWLKLSYYMAR